MTSLPASLFEPSWGQRQVEAKAWATLERCRTADELSDLPLPIPVEQWIEGPLDIRLSFEDLSHLGPHTMGASYVSRNEIVIDERVLNHEGRTRFTCAHELGHFMLHADLDDCGRESKDYDRLEFQANCFAAAFLMPVPLVEHEVLCMCQESDTDVARLLAELMHPTIEAENTWRRFLLEPLVERFQVSMSTAVIRCRTMQARIADARPLMPPTLAKRFFAQLPKRRGLMELLRAG